MQKEKFYLGVGAVILFSAAILGGIRFFSGSEDFWLCQDGQWVKHGQPSSPAPDSFCAPVVVNQEEPVKVASGTVEGSADKLLKPEIEVDSPLLGAEVSSPLLVSGKARGFWYFEGSFPIQVLADNGQVLGVGIASAQGEWMTEDFVPFSANIEFDAVGQLSGKIVFNKDNPSGDAQFDKAYDLPVKFIPIATSSPEMMVKVFFGSEKLNPGSLDCSLVFPVERKIPLTAGVARAAIEELLKGPSQSENDFFSSINSGVKINSLTIASGTAAIDFDAEMNRAIGGSCRVAAIRAQISETLKQFSDVKQVFISVDGQSEDILQP